MDERSQRAYACLSTIVAMIGGIIAIIVANLLGVL
jgi:hypothetical protein